ncbi:hypothetical protein A2V82_16635 [candidate division KSB1 bacterium RBG_16_48_16]|nr:MAG: hypothetical protein A2V82_16635 [candidate division KSB1 bacterium RBG_16_48_16]
MNDHEFTLSVLQPFDLEATLKTHGWFQLAPFYWHEDEKKLTWAVKLKDKTPLRLDFSQQPGARSNNPAFIHVVADKPLTKEEKELAEQKFHHVFNLDVDLNPFYAICRNYPILNQVKKEGMGRVMRSESLYEDVFKSICGTNVQWKQAVKMTNTIASLGKSTRDGSFRVFPSPQDILKAGEPFLKDVGRVGYRSAYLMDLCHRFVNGESRALLAEQGKLSQKELAAYFLSFKGIGKITARYLLALYGHYEELAIDSLVISYMTERHFNGTRPTEQQILDFYAEFGKWRYLAYWMEFIISGGWVPDEKKKN